MKKVLVLAAAIALFATPAFAGIAGTAHDLSTANNGSLGTDSTEICVFCHTPHGAITSTTTYLPLWNRTHTVTPQGFYTSDSMDHTSDAASTLRTDAYLCLSCHDGATSMDALRNPPNSGLTISGSKVITSTADLGTNMDNDHPIGFNYNAAVEGVLGVSELVADPGTDIPFFGDNKEMWCSSCHDVHDNTFSPFLVKSNLGSGLCLSCHIK